MQRPIFAESCHALKKPSNLLFYMMTERYRDGLARGIRWNDPALAIAWPLPDPFVSARDAALPAFEP